MAARFKYLRAEKRENLDAGPRVKGETSFTRNLSVPALRKLPVNSLMEKEPGHKHVCLLIFSQKLSGVNKIIFATCKHKCPNDPRRGNRGWAFPRKEQDGFLTVHATASSSEYTQARKARKKSGYWLTVIVTTTYFFGGFLYAKCQHSRQLL